MFLMGALVVPRVIFQLRVVVWFVRSHFNHDHKLHGPMMHRLRGPKTHFKPTKDDVA